MTRICLALAAAAIAAVAAPSGVGFAVGPSDETRLVEGSSSTVATDARLRRPGGTYIGRRGRLQLAVDAGSIQLASIGFRCGEVTGRTGLNDVTIKRRRGRYRFSIVAHGGVTYSDEESSDNAAIRFSGRFTPTARRALGIFRVRTPRCGGTGTVEWSARRR